MAGEFIAIFAVLTFVISNVIFKRTEHEASPTFINFVRTAVGTLTFFIFAIIFNVFFHIFILPWELWMILFTSFIFGQIIGDTAYFIAQKELGTTMALAVSMIFPLITFILSMIFLNEPFDLRVVFSLTLVGLGIYIIGKSKVSINLRSKSIIESKNYQSKRSISRFKAISFGILAAFGWAFGLVIIDFATNEINRILAVEELSSIIGNVIRFPFALIILLTMVLRENYRTKPVNRNIERSGKTWALLIVGAIIGTSIGAYFYTEAARVAGATVMALIASASPLFSLPLTYFINKEKITKFGFVGVILTILGVIVITF
ncbi:MAG: DMT family transporter [Candidatus Lokiarchaeota archaeon]|nr:DMT family transporter [Candidatus Lokiarchaeota archaeon]